MPVFGDSFSVHGMGSRPDSMVLTTKSRLRTVSLGMRLGDGAAAQAPFGVEDFHGEGSLHDGGGEEFVFEGGAEFVVFGLFVGADDVTGGEEAEGDGVLGDAGAGLGGAGAG